MLNFAGIDMMVDKNNEVTSFIRTYMPTTFYTPWRRQSWPGFGTAGLTYPTGNYVEPPFQLNRLIWPCGASARSNHACSGRVAVPRLCSIGRS
jgi:hypothetical protein